MDYERMDFTKETCFVKLLSCSIPTYYQDSSINEMEKNIMFICIEGAPANKLKINDQTHKVIGTINLSSIFNLWSNLSKDTTQKTRHNFMFDIEGGDNKNFPFQISNFEDINKSRIYIIDGQGKLIDYTIDNDHDTIDRQYRLVV